VTDGVFLFTRTPVMPLGQLQELDEKRQPLDTNKTVWVTMPFAHEKLDAFDRFALKGQRVSLCVGLYHTRPLHDVVVELKGDGLEGPGGALLPVETVEYCPGYLGAAPSRYMKIVGEGTKVEPVNLTDETGVRYFFLTLHAPRDAKAGRYVGAIDVRADGNLVKPIPVSLRVQNMAQPILRDVYVGLIYNGGLPDVDDMLRQYARSGFSQIMWFYRWVPHGKGETAKNTLTPPAWVGSSSNWSTRHLGRRGSLHGYPGG